MSRAHVIDGVRHEPPRVRGDCLPGGRNGARPCPWASCAYHLAVDVNEKTGHLSVHGEPAAMEHTCALDVAERSGVGEPALDTHGRISGFDGNQTLEDIGGLLRVTRERIRQIEARALDELRFHVRAADWR